MDEKEIIEGNVLIAEFMGAIVVAPIGHTGRDICFKEQIEGQYVYQRALLKYHTSWDWLMPVVDDIYYSRRFPTGAQTPEISSKPHKLYKNIEKALLHLSIEQTWQAVVNFITWYNTNNPSTH